LVGWLVGLFVCLIINKITPKVVDNVHEILRGVRLAQLAISPMHSLVECDGLLPGPREAVRCHIAC